MTDEAAIQRLLDRQSIIDCLLRYARGMDRGDFELVLTAYHEDALDDHGYFVGRPADLVKWSAAYRATGKVLFSRHSLTNQTVEFTAQDVAHVESYYRHESVVGQEKPVMRTNLGRYVDRFERRSGCWRIAARVCTVEASCESTHVPLDVQSGFQGGRQDKSDISYMRPLVVTRAATQGFSGPKLR
ncbi:MAG: nuclear transport factor 2 family protein [Gammaproteobacteria bacterium]